MSNKKTLQKLARADPVTDSVCDIVTRAESGASKSRPRSTNTLAVLVVFVGLVATVSCRVCMQHTAARALDL